jgi:hypothetical protein
VIEAAPERPADLALALDLLDDHLTTIRRDPLVEIRDRRRRGADHRLYGKVRAVDRRAVPAEGDDASNV